MKRLALVGVLVLGFIYWHHHSLSYGPTYAFAHPAALHAGNLFYFAMAVAVFHAKYTTALLGDIYDDVAADLRSEETRADFAKAGKKLLAKFRVRQQRPRKIAGRTPPTEAAKRAAAKSAEQIAR